MEAKLEMTAFDLLEHNYSVGNITENTLQNQSTDSDKIQTIVLISRYQRITYS